MRPSLLPCVLSLTILAGIVNADSVFDPEQVYYDWVRADGSLAGGVVLMDTSADEPAEIDASAVAGVVRVWPNGASPEMMLGSSPNRLDLVIVGDGYQTSQLGAYAVHAQNAINAMFSREPFKTYQNLFRVHRVDVVSNDSGVDNDPAQGILRDTALDMAFWCNGTERLLCVSLSKAMQYANTAPFGRNQVLAVANSSKYGGAGYPSSDLATVAGANGSAAEVAIHEFGHSIGNLADEYNYGGPTTYTGGEPSSPNSSKLQNATMLAQQQKWFRWLNESFPQFDGLVSTYEGSSYSQLGVYRPSNNSLMRNLGRPFNMPSAEALIIQMYAFVDPIDDSTPTTQVLDGSEIVFVDPIDLVGASLDVQWFLDAVAIPGATSDQIDLSVLSISSGLHLLEAVVTDNTPWVRNEQARASLMRETRQWAVLVEHCYADCDGNGMVNVFDYVCFGNAFASQQQYADCDGDSLFTVFDYICFGNAYATGCP
ncbi:MAG: hypothetical protein H6815_03055 [Phycisphaeraceae bacterium]|nr:hypothetical protein [Phycisphaerales bacterium]MCB9859406.1 hypothetical protein [Phycisphaeraceae bacterium]